LPIPASGDPGYGRYLDVDGDYWVLPQDVLAVINYLNNRPPTLGQEGEGEAILAPLGLPVAEASVETVGRPLPLSEPEAAIRVSLGRGELTQREDVWTRPAAVTTEATRFRAERTSRSDFRHGQPMWSLDTRSHALAALEGLGSLLPELETSLTAIAEHVARGWANL
jgi:hypothetical protein